MNYAGRRPVAEPPYPAHGGGRRTPPAAAAAAAAVAAPDSTAAFEGRARGTKHRSTTTYHDDAYVGESSSGISSGGGTSGRHHHHHRQRRPRPAYTGGRERDYRDNIGGGGGGGGDDGDDDDDDDDDDDSCSWSPHAAAAERRHGRRISNLPPATSAGFAGLAAAGGGHARTAGDRDRRGHVHTGGGGGGDVGARSRAPIGAAAWNSDRESSSPRRLRLAERLGELESKLASSGGGAPAGAVEGGDGERARPMSTAENEVQSAALRHALLLEERGLQLERTSAQLREKEEEGSLLKSELRRLGEASVADREAWRRLAKAEGEISLLLERSEGLEYAAKRCQASLDAERRARSEDEAKHVSELKRLNKQAAAAAEAASRESLAATSSRDLCEQMGGVCRQMRQAAEEAAARCADAEETARSLRAQLALAGEEAQGAHRESEGLRGRLQAAEQRQRRQESQLADHLGAADEEARQTNQALKEEKDANSALTELVKGLEGRLEKAERNAAASSQGSERCKEVSEELRRGLERSQREAEQLRSRLQISGDLAADEAGRAKEALQAEKAVRSQLASSAEREEELRSENGCLVAKIEDLRATLSKLSTDLSETSKLSQDRLVDSEVSSRAAAAAERRSQSLERRSSDAARAAEAAQSVTVRAEAARAEAERALSGFRGSVARALGAVEDALADALRGVGVRVAGREREGDGEGAWPGGRSGGGGGGGVGLGGRVSLGGARPRLGHGGRGRGGAQGDGGLRGGGEGGGSAAANGKEGGGWLGVVSPASEAEADADAAGVDAAETAMMGRLERILGRIMRTIDAARELRAWVEGEVEVARDAATKGLHDLKGRWGEERTRLQSAEKKLLRLQEQTKYGGRRAALDAREECYAKIERVEKEKWGLRDCLVAERRKSELLEGKASRVQEQLSALSDQVESLKGKQLRQRQEKEQLLAHQDKLQSQLEQQVSRGREKHQELEEYRRSAEEGAARASTLTKALKAERSEREEERAFRQREGARASTEQEEAVLRVSELLEDERVARDEETSRLKGLLEEERRARREESALGEAVLREVRETQGLLGEVSPSSDRAVGGLGASGSRTFRGSVREPLPAQGSASALELQTSRLERLVADASALVKHTGLFYDRYSETHKRPAPVGKEGGDISQNFPGNSLLGSGFAPTATATTFSAGGRTWGGGEEEISGNFLGCAVDNGTAAAAAARGKGGCGVAGLRELDQQCYSLLESNAQLCLKLQGLGVEYAGLTRVLLAAGGEADHHLSHLHDGYRKPLDVADLNGDDGDISGERHHHHHRRRQGRRYPHHDHHHRRRREDPHPQPHPHHHHHHSRTKSSRESKRRSRPASKGGGEGGGRGAEEAGASYGSGGGSGSEGSPPYPPPRHREAGAAAATAGRSCWPLSPAGRRPARRPMSARHQGHHHPGGSS